MSSESGGTTARSLAARFDSALAARFMRKPVSALLGPWRVHMLPTQAGVVRTLDTGTCTDKPCVVIVPDGPSVVEHYVALIERLSRDLRVVCFDMPGFGFSASRTGPVRVSSAALGAARRVPAGPYCAALENVP